MVESDHCWFMYLLPNYFFEKEFLQIADGSSCQLEILFQPWVYEKEMMGPDMMEIKNTIGIKE